MVPLGGRNATSSVARGISTRYLPQRCLTLESGWVHHKLRLRACSGSPGCGSTPCKSTGYQASAHWHIVQQYTNRQLDQEDGFKIHFPHSRAPPTGLGFHALLSPCGPADNCACSWKRQHHGQHRVASIQSQCTVLSRAPSLI